MPEETILVGGETVETVETLADGTIVAPVPQTETQSETVTETEKPVQTLQNSIVNVSMTMTFYETAYGAESLDGLIIMNPPAADSAENAG